MRQVELLGLQLEPTTQSPLVVLRENDDPNRFLPVFVGPAEAAAIAIGLSGNTPPRPLTHDLMVELIAKLNVAVERVEITSVDGDAFVASLVLSSPSAESSEGARVDSPIDGIRVDARPSDAIAIALRTQAPVYVSEDVLDDAGITPEAVRVEPVAPHPSAIDAEVDQFRAFLDQVAPDDFANGTSAT